MAAPPTPAVLRKWTSSTDAWYLVFDSVITENVNLTSVITTHPIAGRSPVADHMYDQPNELNLVVLVSNTHNWVNLDVIAAGEEPADLFYSPNVSRAQKALDMLDDIRQAHEPFDVQTGLRLFKNMVIEKISYTTDQNTGQILQANVALKAAKIVWTKAVFYPVRKDKKTKRAAPAPADKGKVEAQQVELTEEEKKKLMTSWVVRGMPDFLKSYLPGLPGTGDIPVAGYASKPGALGQ